MDISKFSNSSKLFIEAIIKTPSVFALDKSRSNSARHRFLITGQTSFVDVFIKDILFKKKDSCYCRDRFCKEQNLTCFGEIFDEFAAEQKAQLLEQSGVLKAFW